jgi:hypothetical protein
MFETLLIGFIGICAWLLTNFVAKPLRRFFDLRRDVNRCLVRYGNVSARARWTDDNKREVLQISPEEDERLMEAHNALRDLAGDMRAFANVEIVANRIVICLGYDADKIASALVGYSNNILAYGKMRSNSHDQVQRLLRINADEAAPQGARRSWFLFWPFRKQ